MTLIQVVLIAKGNTMAQFLSFIIPSNKEKVATEMECASKIPVIKQYWNILEWDHGLHIPNKMKLIFIVLLLA